MIRSFAMTGGGGGLERMGADKGSGLRRKGKDLFAMTGRREVRGREGVGYDRSAGYTRDR